MGDHIYYYRKDAKNRKNYFIRRAPATVAQTAATQRAATDFGIASKCSSLIRTALRPYTDNCYDNTLHYRLNRKMGEILRADATRIFTPDNMQSLQHFRLNAATSIQPQAIIENNDTGAVNISFPDTFRALGSITHQTVKAIALSVNFAKNSTCRVESNTVIIKPGEKCGPLTMTINRRNLTLIILEIQSWYEVNGQLHKAQNRKTHALDVMAVLVPLEIPTDTTIRYRNKAPHFWLPYAAPAQQTLIIRRVKEHSPPEG